MKLQSEPYNTMVALSHPLSLAKRQALLCEKIKKILKNRSPKFIANFEQKKDRPRKCMILRIKPPPLPENVPISGYNAPPPLKVPILGMYGVIFSISAVLSAQVTRTNSFRAKSPAISLPSTQFNMTLLSY